MNGRMNRLICPFSQCEPKTFVRLDRHLKRVHDLHGPARRSALTDARSKAVTAPEARTPDAPHTGHVRPTPAQADPEGPPTPRYPLSRLFRNASIRSFYDTESLAASNPQQGAMRAFRLLTFLSEQTDPPDHASLTDPERVRRLFGWLDHLGGQGLAPTTAHQYVVASRRYVLHLEATHQMSPEACGRMNAALLTLLRQARRTITPYRQMTQEGLVEDRMNPADLLRFRGYALTQVRCCLKRLRRRQSLAEFSRCYRRTQALLAAYLVGISGHRIGAVTGLKRGAVSGCGRAKNGLFVIRMPSHKTSAHHGALPLSLTATELRYLREFSRVVAANVLRSTHLFVTLRGNRPPRGLLAGFRREWVSAGLPVGKNFYFGKVRRCLTTAYQAHLSPKLHRQMAESIGHSEATAQRFYSDRVFPVLDQVAEYRVWSDDSLQAAANV